MKEILASIVLVGLLILVVNPMHFWMPTSAHMLVLGALAGVFGLLAVFVLREQVSDEREHAHRALAGRAAFLLGSAVLICGIVVQGLQHAVDPWLAGALAGMVLAKIGTRAYSDRHL